MKFKTKVLVGLAFLLVLPFISEKSFATNSCSGSGADNTDTGCQVDSAVGIGGANTHQCIWHWMEFQSSSNSLVGSFDSTFLTGTTRTPMRINLSSNISSGAPTGVNLCRIEIFRGANDHSTLCGTNRIVDRVFVNDNNALNQPNKFQVDIDPSTFGSSTTNNFTIGNLCINVTTEVSNATVSQNVSNVAGIALAPYINQSSLSAYTVNYFSNITIFPNILNGSIVVPPTGSAIIYDLARVGGGVESATIASDTTLAKNTTIDLISLTTTPTANANYELIFRTWADRDATNNRQTHSRFHTNSSNSSSGTAPISEQFNLTDSISCNQYVDLNGFASNLYNRNEITNVSGTILNATGINLNRTSSVSSHLRFRASGSSTDEFSNLSWNINSTGGFNRVTSIPLNANGSLDLIGQNYNVIYSMGDNSNMEMNCTYSNAIKVSRALNGSVYFLTGKQKKIYIGNENNEFSTIRKARGDKFGNSNATVKIFDANNAQRANFNFTANTTGENSTGTANLMLFITRPLGFWTANISDTTKVSDNGNNTILGINDTILATQKAARDPITLSCNPNGVNSPTFCSFRSQDLDAGTLTNQNFSYNVSNQTAPLNWVFQGQIVQNGATTTGNITPIYDGLFAMNFTPTTSGSYVITVNNTNDVNSTATVIIVVSSGALTNAQQGQLDTIVNEVNKSRDSANQSSYVINQTNTTTTTTLSTLNTLDNYIRIAKQLIIDLWSNLYASDRQLTKINQSIIVRQ